ncbi:MAG: ribosome biogenesis GTPase YlqF [Gammaproteobacteria bacterium]|nr:ribosome biogenesis GTPase YlqF [Gammaproteobacteria bacterium]
MLIGWYPGHMNKARKEIIHALKKVHAILEVVDARLPYSSENPLLRELTGDKPVLKLLNKTDLADPGLTSQWLSYFAKNNVSAMAITSNSQTSLSKTITRHFRSLQKAAKPPFKVMVVGIPNAGKSTLINNLTNRKIAKTGNEPAITKGQQEIKLDEDFLLVDTPGILWPKIEDQDSAYRLAVTGAIKNTAIVMEDIALYAIAFLKTNYPENLQDRYTLDTLDEEPIALLEEIGAKRGCLRKGGVDHNKAAVILLNDIRSQKLGQITLESPTEIPKSDNENSEQD